MGNICIMLHQSCLFTWQVVIKVLSFLPQCIHEFHDSSLMCFLHNFMYAVLHVDYSISGSLTFYRSVSCFSEYLLRTADVGTGLGRWQINKLLLRTTEGYSAEYQLTRHWHELCGNCTDSRWTCTLHRVSEAWAVVNYRGRKQGRFLCGAFIWEYCF